MEDYPHHKEDRAVGSPIGFVFAALAYLMYWHSSFSAKHGTPKMVYSNDVENTANVLTQSEDPQPEENV
ncbi:hypothetical protein CALVIDRAFT_601162 [Calocera viscosa TUFC12733]|uniref:Uncharacterized protein n=1 Tax=Calocera viscosa (strain TUFC12733) TaxID=1330018 RepID=A0A167IRJ3_CALVF|nr:hypothetical protein CALVIDRAFT_601162 [Calocera viscosa TUFC12733]